MSRAPTPRLVLCICSDIQPGLHQIPLLVTMAPVTRRRWSGGQGGDGGVGGLGLAGGVEQAEAPSAELVAPGVDVEGPDPAGVLGGGDGLGELGGLLGG